MFSLMLVDDAVLLSGLTLCLWPVHWLPPDSWTLPFSQVWTMVGMRRSISLGVGRRGEHEISGEGNMERVGDRNPERDRNL